MAEQILEDFPIENLVNYVGKEGSRFRITKLSELNLESEGPSPKGLARSTERLQFGRRSRVESYCDVLYAIGSGAEKPTHIMYNANLSWNVLDAHIEKLVRKGLVIVERENRKKYHLSGKGFKVLKQTIHCTQARIGSSFGG